ncbi:MAG: thioredoxin family protein [Silicimonas sp.]|nr:thioredoxin family protein [Silicimonas sp.]
MDRRTFLLTSTALLAAGPALAASGMAYTPGLVQQKLDAGEVVFLDFYTDWCTTCAAQQRVISKLKAENDAYKAITFISVNWDEFKNAELTKSLNIPRRSTLVALSKSGEVGRIVAGTSKRDIKALMDQALALA